MQSIVFLTVLTVHASKPINQLIKSRLRAVPFTRFSLEGQNLFESNNRKDRDQGAGTFATIADSTMGEDD